MRKSTIFGLTAGLVLSAGLVYAATAGTPAVQAEEEETPVYPILDPEPGCYTEINQITVTLEGRVGFYGGNVATATLENTTTDNVWYCYEPEFKGYDADGNTTYTFNFSEMGSTEAVTIDEAGNYVLSLKGLYTTVMDPDTEEGENTDLPVMTFNYTIYPVVYEVYPANGSTLTSLTEVNLDFTYAVTGTLNASLVDAEGEDYEPTVSGDNNMNYVITVGENGESLEPGSYTLTLSGLTYNGEKLNDIVLNYTVVEAVEYYLNPVPGYVTSLDKVVVTFAEGANVGFYENTRPAVATLEGEEGTYYCTEPFFVGRSADGEMMYELTFAELGATTPAEIAPGEYTLTITGYYTTTLNGDVESEPVNQPNIVAEYTLVDAGTVTVTPAAGETTDLSKVTVTFSAKDVKFAGGQPTLVTLQNLETGDAYYGNVVAGTAATGTVYNVTFSEAGSTDAEVINLPGNYELKLNGFYLAVDDDMAEYPVMTYNYTIPYPVAYTLSPEAGMVEDLSKIVLTYAENVQFIEKVRPAAAILENTTTGQAYYWYGPSSTAAAKEYTLTFQEIGEEEDAVVNQPGDYTLTVMGAYTGGNTDNTLPVLTVKYTIPYPVSYSLNPYDGATVEDLSTITVSFYGANVGFYDVHPAVATLDNLTTGETYYCVTPEFGGYDADGVKTLTLKFSELGSDEVEQITAVGEYELNIRGLYTTTIDDNGNESDPEDLPVITAKYTIPYPVEYTVSPVEGTVTELSEIYVTFDNSLGVVGFYEYTRPAVGVLENLETGEAWYCTDPQIEDIRATDSRTYIFTFTELGAGNPTTGEGEDDNAPSTEEGDEVGSDATPLVIDMPGTYQFTVRGAYIGTVVDGEEETLLDLPPLTVNYTIPYPISYTLNPVSGSTLSEISEVVLTFEAGANVGFYDNVRPGAAMLENIDNGQVYYCTAPFFMGRSEDGEMSYSLKFTELGGEDEVAVNVAGNYTLTIMGLYTTTIDEDGEESEPEDLPVIHASYAITFPYGFEFTPESGSEVDAINTVVLTFFNNPNIGFYDVHPAVATLENLDLTEYWYCASPKKDRTADGGSTITMTFSELGDETPVEINYNGEYLLTVRGLYTSSIDEDGNESDPEDLPVLTATYYIVNGVTGIETVIDTDVYNVYSINGVQVVKNGSAADVNALGSGLYIVNGKKVLIRR